VEPITSSVKGELQVFFVSIACAVVLVCLCACV
jgi:hypothetical protein